MMSHPAFQSDKARIASIPFYKVGAVCYGLWGFWHFRVVASLFEFAATQIMKVFSRCVFIKAHFIFSGLQWVLLHSLFCSTGATAAWASGLISL